MDADRPAAPLERDTLRDLVGRALKHEPIDYLVGEKWFFGMAFHVSPAVLVPRPSTETIVENVLLHARAEPGFGGKTGEGVRFADVCTGSGCIAVALLKHLTGAAAVATDISPDALAIAKKNAARHGVADRIEFLQGDLLAPLTDATGVTNSATTDLHYLLANPPYIPDHEWDAVPANVKDFEPHAARRGRRPDVRSPARRGRSAFPWPGGVLMVEVARARPTIVACRGSAATRERARSDRFDGLPRVVVATRACSTPPPRQRRTNDKRTCRHGERKKGVSQALGVRIAPPLRLPLRIVRDLCGALVLYLHHTTPRDERKRNRSDRWRTQQPANHAARNAKMSPTWTPLCPSKSAAGCPENHATRNAKMSCGAATPSPSKSAAAPRLGQGLIADIQAHVIDPQRNG